MLTKTPDYIISELGYPQWQHCEQKPQYNLLYGKSAPQPPASSGVAAPRLLPLRETLGDYYKRLLGEQAARGRARDARDAVAQQKQQKNLWNEQQQQRQQRSCHSRRHAAARSSNQKCRDKSDVSDSNNF